MAVRMPSLRPRLPVLAAEALYDKKPSAVVILPWRFAESIRRRHHAYLDGGGRFVVPWPRLEVF